jgi:archaellin
MTNRLRSFGLVKKQTKHEPNKIMLITKLILACVAAIALVSATGCGTEKATHSSTTTTQQTTVPAPVTTTTTDTQTQSK